MEWLTILCSFFATILAGGGIYGLFTIRENKKAAKLENDKKEQELKEAQEDQAIEMWKGLAEEYKAQIETLTEQLKEKDAKIDEVFHKVSDLNAELLETKVALQKAKLLKCSKLACIDRIPPLGYDEAKSELD